MILKKCSTAGTDPIDKIPVPSGKFSESLDVVPLLVYGGEAKAHKYHSGQFRSTIQRRWICWETALENMIGVRVHGLTSLGSPQ